jgi:hypothetical protein
MLRGLAALAVVAVVAGSARADDLADARAAVDASDYLAARGALDKALAGGKASPDDLADIYRMKGIVDAALGNTAAATTAFGKWLALDPKAALPAGTSPKITRPFDAAQDQAKGREPIKVKAETTADPPSVTLVIVSDPYMMIDRARVFVRVDGGKEQKLEASGKKKIKIELPTGKRLDLRVQALDEAGNRVAVVGTSDVPLVIVGPGGGETPVVVKKHDEAPKPVVVRDEHPRPLYLKWWVWAGGAVAIGAGATYFGLSARDETDRLTQLNANSFDHRFTEASSLESDAKRDAMIFNVGMGVAGAVAIGAAILYLTEPHAEAHVAAAPINGGGAVVVGGRF